MSLFDLLKKFYSVKTKCYNCGHVQDLKIPKGNVIDDYLKTESSVCANCGNATLRRAELANVKIKQAVTGYPVQQPRRLAQITTRPRPQPPRPPQLRPKPRPQQIRPQPPQVVEYPAPEEVYKEPEDEFGLKPKRVNLWTGREE